jgi:hypothetical protein
MLDGRMLCLQVILLLGSYRSIYNMGENTLKSTRSDSSVFYRSAQKRIGKECGGSSEEDKEREKN